MKIKRSSWHYKISNFWAGYERRNDNLCWYFWRGVLKLALAVWVLILLVAIAHSYFTSPQVISATIMLVFVVSIFVVPYLAIIFLRGKLGKSPEMPYENIVTECLKARKNKVCPLIKYVD